MSLSKIARTDLERVAGEYGYSKIEDLHAALGYGRFSARQVLQKLTPQTSEPQAPEPPRPVSPAAAPAPAGDLVLKVKGAEDLLVYRAKCCNPIPGESIVGYITRGKGVAVHSANCPNVQSLLYEVERRIDVEWARSASEFFPVKMIVHAEDRPGILNHLTAVLAGEDSNIRNLEARPDEAHNGDGAIIEMTVDVRDKKQLERIVASMRRMSGVRDVERLM